MHIAFAVFNAGSDGAVMSVTRRQCEALVAAGHSVSLVTNQAPNLTWEGVRVVITRSKPPGIFEKIWWRIVRISGRFVLPGGWAFLDAVRLSEQLTAMRAIERALHDIVLQTPIDLCLCCQHAMSFRLAQFRKLADVPFAIVSHGDIFSHPFKAFSLPLREFYRRGTLFAYQNANCVYSVSRAMAEIAVQHGCPPTRSAYMPNGLDPSEIGWPAKHSIIRRRTWRLLVVGRLAPEKGHEYAIEALSLLKHLDVELVIVGDGPCERKLRAQASHLGVTDRCTFIGKLDRKALGDHYAAANLVLQPSLSEASGLAIKEALLTGTPVIASRVGGIPEIVRNGIDGYLVNPRDAGELANAVCSVLEAPGLLKAMRCAASSRALDYRWDTLLSRWIADIEVRFS